MNKTTKISIVLFGVAVIIPVGASLAGADGSRFAKGKEIYQGTCIACHGANGKGEIPGTPNFTKADGVLRQSDDVLIEHITDGYESPGADMPMPPKGGNEDLTDEDIKAVLAYIRHEFGAKENK